LWLCGDSQLNLRLGPLGGITELDFHDHSVLSTSRWPRLIGSCVALRHLKIIASFRPLGPLSTIWKDLSGLKRLVSIHFQFSEAEMCFFEPEPDVSLDPTKPAKIGRVRDMGAHFPILRSLKLSGTIECFTNEDIKLLPPTIKELDLSRFYPRFKDLPLSSLPLNLRKVDIHHPIDSFEQLPPYTETVAFRSSMSLSCAPLHLLPPSVTALELFEKNRPCTNLSGAILPDTILSMEILSPHYPPPSKLPKFLTRLELFSGGGVPLDTLIQSLPDSLETFRIKACSILTAQQTAKLPRGLKVLQVPVISNSLYLTMDDGQKSPTLPPSLVSLDQLVSSEALPFLPQTLIDLKLSSLGDSPDDSVIERDMSLLPPRLTHLNASVIGLGCERFFHLFPRTLHRIVAEIPISHAEAPAKLPLELQRTMFRMETPERLPNLSHLTQMRSVGLRLCKVTLTPSFCASLPPRLESINVKGLEVKFEKEALACLPSVLRSLNLAPSIPMPDSHFGFLPRRLKRLLCSGGAITQPETIKDLPRGLTELNLSNCKLPVEITPLLPYTINFIHFDNVKIVKPWLEKIWKRIQALPDSQPDPRVHNPNFMQEAFDEIYAGFAPSIDPAFQVPLEKDFK
jgi:hypothetical protein